MSVADEKNIEAIYPLSPMQQGMLFHALYAPNAEAYFEQLHCALTGALNVPAFMEAWQRVVERHAILRTAFVWEDLDQPLQVVGRQATLPWEQHDWRAVPADQQPARLEAFLSADRHRGFDLTQAPLMRMALIQISADTYWFVSSHHHLLLDGWSLPILFKEFFTFYDALRTNTAIRLPRTRSYGDYITWLEHQDMRQAESFWRTLLKGFSSATPFAFERAPGRTPQGPERYGEHEQLIPEAQTAALYALARHAQVTVNTLVQAAWAWVLGRYAEQDDVVFGATVSGRPADLPGVDQIVGLFINTLPVRVRITPTQPLVAWLKALQTQQSEVRQYEYSPLSQVQTWSAVPRGQALFESILVFENYPLDRDAQPEQRDFEVGDLVFFERTTYPLTFVALARETLRLRVLYDQRRFNAPAIAQLVAHLAHVLTSMAADPAQPVGALAWQTPAERAALTQWNAVAAPYPNTECIHTRFAQQALRTPNAPAATFGTDSLSYHDLNARANQLAHHLIARGVQPGARVGLAVERSLDMLVGTLAILKAGAAYLPLDPTYPPERLAFMLADGQVTTLLTQAALLPRLPAHDAHVICLDRDWDTIATHSPTTDPTVAVTAEHLAYIIYTSGSTGVPKGVGVPHRAVLRLVCNTTYLPFGPTERIAQASNISFDAATFELWGALLHGAELIGVSREVALSPHTFVRFLQDARITALFLTTALFNQIAREVPDGFHTLRHVLFGGEAVDPRAVRTVLAHGAPQRLLHVYGPTESTTFATWHRVTAVPDDAFTVPIGGPLSNTTLYVLDRTGQLAPLGAPGELFIGGDGLAWGYHQRPALTAERFVPDPFSAHPGARLYRTGDQVRWTPAGAIEFLARLDQQIKLRGFRIELGEVEDALLACPGVAHAAALLREDTPGDKRLVAYLVPTAGTTLSVSDLRRTLGQRLPEYMVPAAFVFLAALPLNANGKVDRRALPAPDQARPELSAAFVAPRDAREQALAEIWQAVLNLAQVGIYDNFFELGGDSILSIQIIARANSAGLRLTPRQLFEHRTIAALAAVVNSAPSVQATQDLLTGPVALTPIQQWFFEQDAPAPAHWNQSVMLALRQPLDPALLERAWQHLVTHHDALRLRYTPTPTGWLQTHANLDGQLVSLRVDSATALPAPDWRAATTAVQASLDLAHGPLVAVWLYDGGAHKPSYLFMAIHHLVVDGVSWRILLEDLWTLYEQFERGEAPTLPAKTTAYQHWATRLTEYAASAALRTELNFWLDPARAAVSAPPTDHAGINREDTARNVTVTLSAAETHALLQEAPRAYRTQINDLLLAALAQALARWTGQDTIGVDLEGHGREALFDEVDLSRTVGWFTSIFPVALTLPADRAPGTVLKAIKEQLRQIPQRGVGYGILRYLSPDATVRTSLAALPSTQVSFNYLGQFSAGQPDDQARASLADVPTGPAHGPLGQRSHWLEITGLVSAGELEVDWTYSTALHDEATITRVAADFLAALRALIAHCLTPEAGGFTPSDFPLARLTQPALDQLYVTQRGLTDIYPLSPTQQGMLFHTLYAPEAGEYFEQFEYTLERGVDAHALRRAWEQAVQRHTILRTGFVWENLPEAKQIVFEQVALPWAYHDWRSVPVAEHRARLTAFMQADRRQGFTLNTAPLMRVALFRLSDDVYQLIWSIHHLLLDGWSGAVLLQDLFTLYAAARAQRPAHLPDPVPYRDYIAWLARQDLAQAETFWRTFLHGFDTPTPLVVERTSSRTLAGTASYAEVQTDLPAATTQAAHALARTAGVTMNTLVQAAWAWVLGRYAEQDDVVFGATVSGRPADLPGVDQIVGLFINTLPVRVRITPATPLADWLKTLQAQQAEVRQYEYSPLVQIQKWSAVPRGQALFESIIVFENYPTPRAETYAPEDALHVRDFHSFETTNYPLTLVVQPGDELALQLIYDERRFNAPAIAQLVAHLAHVLISMAADPAQPVGALAWQTPAERAALTQWNAVATPYPNTECIHTRFAQQALRTPNAPAATFGTDSLSYHDLNARANQLAHHLIARGVQPGARIGLAVERSLDMLVGTLAILKTGAAYLPLDPTYPPERLAFMLADGEVTTLLTQAALLPRLPAHDGAHPAVSGAHVICLDRDWDTIAASSPTTDPTVAVTAEHLAYIIYTSGSTGTPKGVGVPHRAVLRLVCNTTYLPFGPTERIAQASNISFDAATFELWGALLHGAELIGVSREVALSPHTFVRFLQDARITALFLTTALFNQIAREVPAGFHTLRHVLFGGEAVDPRAVRTVLAHGAPQRLLHVYGPTESTTFATWHSVTAVPDDAFTVPIGGPLSNTTLYVLDRTGQLAPLGAPGELFIGGDGLAWGYHQRPALTAERFVPDPFSTHPGARLYRTGDQVRWTPAGTIEFLARLDQQIKLRGFRIELGEVEDALLACPGVAHAVALLREDTPGDKRLVAYLVPTAGTIASPAAASPAVPGISGTLSVSDLRRTLGQRLPEYMVPAAFVFLAALPLNANGKVDRRALPAPDQARPELSAAFVAPRDAREQALAEIWQAVLNLAQVGIYDNFFELGGDSILSIQIVARANAASVPVTARQLFEHRTIAALAALAATAAPAAADITVEPFALARLTPETLQRLRTAWPALEDVYPLSPMQQSMLTHTLYAPESAVGFDQLLYTLDGALDVSAFMRAWETVVAHYPILRTSCVWEDVPQPCQLMHRTVTLPWEHLDWRALPPDTHAAELNAYLAANHHRGLDLGQPPLMRFTLIRLAEASYEFIWSFHQLLLDGWSVSLLIKDVFASYEALCHNAPITLPTARPYRDYIGWLQRQDPAAAQAFWRRTLESVTAPTPLVVERVPDTDAPSADYGVQELALSVETTNALQAVARQHQLTLNTLVQGAWGLLLSRYSGEHDVVFGATVSGRPSALPGVEGILGSFINNLPVRMTIQPEAPARVSLQALQTQQLELRQYEYNPLAQVRGWSAVPWHLPLFESILVFQNQPGALQTDQGSTFAVSGTRSVARTSYALALVAVPGSTLWLELTYNAHRFDASTITRMLGHLEQLLTALSTDIEQPAAALPLLTPAERALLGDELFCVLDAHGQPAPAEIVGMLFLRTPPNSDAHARPDPLNISAALYATGEQARYHMDGTLERLGPHSESVLVRGHRVTPSTVTALLTRHPAVADAVVRAQPDASGALRLMAYWVARETPGPSAGLLRAFLREYLPEHLLPATFVRLDALPRTPDGHIAYADLPTLEQARVKFMRDAFIAPDDTLTIQLTQIWEDVLDIQPIAPDDNFFDLGGNSILAVHLMTRIQKTFGQDLPLASLFAGATIASLTERLRRPADERPWSALVPIQPLGQNPPFFAVHPAGGNILAFADLARCLPHDQPFYALQSVGLDGRHAPFSDLHDMAAYYLEEIRQVQPHGPYYLGGLSFGGLVAFEIAQQLHDQNEPVALLALFDTWATVFDNHATHDFDPAATLADLAEDIAQRYGQDFTLDLAVVRALAPDAQVEYVLEQMRRAQVLPPGVGLAEMQRFLHLHHANVHAMQTYHPQIYHGPLTLFRVDEIERRYEDLETHAVFKDESLGWNALSTVPTEVFHITGNHITMMFLPHVKLLAQNLMTCITRSLAAVTPHPDGPPASRGA